MGRVVRLAGLMNQWVRVCVERAINDRTRDGIGYGTG